MNQGKMTAKEMMDKIIDGIPESVYTGTQEEIEIKLALYVYTELGKLKSVDERIYWANGKIAYRIVQQSREDSKDINKLAGKRKLICISIANLYKRILNRLGIQCETRRGEPPDVHLDNVITLRSGRKILADLQLDLYNVRTKRKLECFKAIGKEDFLDDNTLTDYLMSVGYIFDSQDYRNNKVKDIKKKIRFLSAKEALANIVGSDEVYKGIEGIDVSEAYIYYKETLAQLLDRKRFREIYRFPCYVLDQNKEPRYSTFCFFADTGNYRNLVPYLYSTKYGRMLVCDLDTLGNLQDEGLHFGSSQFSRSGRKIERYIQQARAGKKLRKEMGFER